LKKYKESNKLLKVKDKNYFIKIYCDRTLLCQKEQERQVLTFDITSFWGWD